jgi:hypothetical protein
MDVKSERASQRAVLLWDIYSDHLSKAQRQSPSLELKIWSRMKDHRRHGIEKHLEFSTPAS